MLCGLFSPVAEATDGGLKCFLGINVNVSGLEGPACWLSMTRKEVGCPHDCYTLVATSVLKIPFWWDRVGLDFSGRVPGYSRQWAIIGDSTKISTFTNLKHTQIMGSNYYFISRRPPFLHSKQYDTEEMLTKKRFLYIQNMVVAINVESRDLSVKHSLLLECSFGIETLFFFRQVNELY